MLNERGSFGEWCFCGCSYLSSPPVPYLLQCTAVTFTSLACRKESYLFGKPWHPVTECLGFCFSFSFVFLIISLFISLNVLPCSVYYLLLLWVNFLWGVSSSDPLFLLPFWLISFRIFSISVYFKIGHETFLLYSCLFVQIIVTLL